MGQEAACVEAVAAGWHFLTDQGPGTPLYSVPPLAH